jgi:hypothetical protein
MGEINCCKKSGDIDDEKELIASQIEPIENPISDDMINLNDNFKSIPRRNQNEHLDKLKTLIQKNILTETNEEVTLEEMNNDDFENEIEKNKSIQRILKSKENELEEILYNDDDILFQSPPLKFTNQKGEIEYYSGTYDKTGNLCGKGVLIGKDGIVYKGTFKNGLFDGKGILINKNGNYYFGDWKNGECEGKGQIIVNDTILYEGNFKNNEKNGEGIENFEDGSVYKGNYVNNKKNGYGKYIYPDSSYYEGNFKNDLFNGEGEFKWKDGRKYKGNFKNGLMDGNGINYWDDGTIYEGNYYNNIKQGQGTYLWNNGNKLYCNFINNEPHGDVYFVIGDNKYNAKFRYGKMISNKIDSERTTNRTEN